MLAVGSQLYWMMDDKNTLCASQLVAAGCWHSLAAAAIIAIDHLVHQASLSRPHLAY